MDYRSATVINPATDAQLITTHVFLERGERHRPRSILEGKVFQYYGPLLRNETVLELKSGILTRGALVIFLVLLRC